MATYKLVSADGKVSYDVDPPPELITKLTANAQRDVALRAALNSDQLAVLDAVGGEAALTLDTIAKRAQARGDEQTAAEIRAYIQLKTFATGIQPAKAG